MGPIGAGLIAGGVSSTGGLAGNLMNNLFNQAENKKNRDFQKEMRDTALISSVNQAEKLGISPSLILGGGGGGSLGGSAASASGNSNPIGAGVDQFTKILLQDKQLQAQQEMAEEKAEWDLAKQRNYLNHLEEMAKIRNTAMKKEDGIMKHNYTKDELNNLFDNLDDIEI